jgi:hypothetical protein
LGRTCHGSHRRHWRHRGHRSLKSSARGASPTVSRHGGQ